MESEGGRRVVVIFCVELRQRRGRGFGWTNKEWGMGAITGACHNSTLPPTRKRYGTCVDVNAVLSLCGRVLVRVIVPHNQLPPHKATQEIKIKGKEGNGQRRDQQPELPKPDERTARHTTHRQHNNALIRFR